MSWTDTNTNRQLDAGELGAFTGFPRGLFPTVDPDASRPYSDEINVGVEHQLMPNLAVGVSYHRRQHRDGLGLIDAARPAERLHAGGPHLRQPGERPDRGDHGLQAAAAVRRAAETA